MADVVVLGSLNMDLVLKTERNPSPGETICSQSFEMHPGGKGNNQAVALGKLGAEVLMLGCVGRDDYGKRLVRNLRENGVNADYILEVDDSSGIAFINVFKGQNTIILYSGANGHCTVDTVKPYAHIIKGAKILLTQLEIPYETVKWALKTAHDNGVITVLNPAPARPLDEDIWRNVDVIVPNEIECKALLEPEANRMEYGDIIKRIIDKSVKNVVVTLGAQGCVYNSGDTIKRQEAVATNVVDTTGAGDAFIGGLVFALSKGKGIDEAVWAGSRVAAIKIGFMGAQEYVIDPDIFS
ncbi:ribokinase [Caldanaerobius polysaccharolyticus]|uniref:ribokinase n=1 Tax=Caldanaerobius polysaccharolyticus TaxID=44256 RepID=UPI00047A3861|nr:ribokinase [Caldanaerobius polysaccharolyticus]